MRPLEAWLLNYAVNALWQVPIVFVAAWLAARTSRRAGPAFQHVLWTSALVAEVLLPACTARPEQIVQALLHWIASFRQSSVVEDPHVTITMGPVQTAAEGFHLPPMLLTAAATLYLIALAYFVIRLSIGLYRTASLRRRSEPLALIGHAGQSYHRFAQLFGVQNSIVAASAEIASPITLGVRRPVLLLPSALDTNLLGEDLDAALAHELAHMRRRDFAKNLAYEILSLPVAFNPLLWLTRSHMTESRELICDAMAADAVAGRQRYARSLLRLATKFSERPRPTTPHAIGIFDANPFKNFERRIMSLTNKPMELRGAARLATAALSLFLIAGACTSALAFRMQVDVPPAQAAPTPITTIKLDPQPIREVRLVAPAGQTTPITTIRLDPQPIREVRLIASAEQTPTPTPTPAATITVDPQPAPHITVDASAEPTKTPSVQAFTANPSPNPTPAAFTLGVPRSATGQPAQSFKVDIADASSPNPVVKVLSSPHIEPDQAEAGRDPHVSATVMAGNRISSEMPAYPEVAKKAKLNGTVVLDAIIGKDGTMKNLSVASSSNPLFNNSAIDAVRQWTYKPYLLNGNPTEVETTITVNYVIGK
jgi:TonB family protein